MSCSTACGRAARSKTSNGSPVSPSPGASGAEGDAVLLESGPELAELRISPLAGEAPDALLCRVGPAPIEADGRNVADALAAMYAHLAEAAERRALSDADFETRAKLVAEGSAGRRKAPLVGVAACFDFDAGDRAVVTLDDDVDLTFCLSR